MAPDAEDRSVRTLYKLADYINVIITRGFLTPFEFIRLDKAVRPSLGAARRGIQSMVSVLVERWNSTPFLANKGLSRPMIIPQTRQKVENIKKKGVFAMGKVFGIGIFVV
jgi:hypothetical protein